jgi:hypothetical protein
VGWGGGHKTKVKGLLGVSSHLDLEICSLSRGRTIHSFAYSPTHPLTLSSVHSFIHSFILEQGWVRC